MIRWARVGIGLMLGATLACTGEPRLLPPRTPPSRTPPGLVVPATPVPERHARVVLETTDGPMRVEARYDPSFVPPGGAVAATQSGELCITPCVVDLPVGRYRLFFSATEHVAASAGDVDDLSVPEPGAYALRRAPGLYRTPSITDAIGPGAVIVLSTIAFTAGLVIAADDDSAPLGLVLAGGGVVGAVAGGIWAYDASRATRQEGSSTFWRLH